MPIKQVLNFVNSIGILMNSVVTNLETTDVSVSFWCQRSKNKGLCTARF